MMTRTSLIVLDCEGGGEGHGAIVLPPPQTEQVVVGSKYAESVTDWKTYSSLSLGKLPPGQSLSHPPRQFMWSYEVSKFYEH